VAGIPDIQPSVPTPSPSVLLVIGTSTGGPKALTQLFLELPLLPDTACCIVQHMPARFTANLARRLNDISVWGVREATNGERIESGNVYIAPGGSQMTVSSADASALSVASTGAINGHQPSVDALCFSVAATWKGDIIAVLMTGMGKDGALGLKEIRMRGGHTIVESEASCVVYGMPRAAVQIDAADEIVPLSEIGRAIQKVSEKLRA